ncbi:MAG: M42 family peptidase, partial [Anaerolineae bacterium]
AVFATRFGFLNTPPGDGKTGVVKGKALDDRAGCAMLVELLRRTHPVNVVGVFSVQEEIGLRGAQVAAHKVDPDLSIVLECTTADDLPPAPDEPIGYPRLGDGPCLTIMDRSFIAGRQLLEHIKTTAERRNIPWQYKRPGLGGTDSGAIHKSRAGIPSVTVAVPARYIHSPAALVQLTDFWHCVELIAAALRHMPQRRPDPSL